HPSLYVELVIDACTLVSRQHCLFFFFFNDTATTEIYTLSLHDALPISAHGKRSQTLFMLQWARSLWRWRVASAPIDRARFEARAGRECPARGERLRGHPFAAGGLHDPQSQRALAAADIDAVGMHGDQGARRRHCRWRRLRPPD